jgi:hypothetical protein
MNRAISVMLTIVACLTVIAITSCETPLRSAERTADDWFRLVTELQQNHEAKLDKEERYFVRYMINWLTIDGHAIPTAPQQQWLLNIKHNVDK